MHFVGLLPSPEPRRATLACAATTSVGIITVSMALYQKLALPFPGEGKSDEWILIYGGSTATGSLAIQYAKL